MALSKSMLKGMGLTEEQVKAIIDGHEETLDYYQGEVEKYKKASETAENQLKKVQNDLNKMKEEANDNDGKNPYKVKYEAIKEEYESYKKDIAKKETLSAKENAYRDLLKDCGVNEKRINAVVKVTDLEGVELDENGKIKDADTLKKGIEDEWSDFITKNETKGASTSTPPQNTGGKMTKEEILAIKDTSLRQQKMYENKELFI